MPEVTDLLRVAQYVKSDRNAPSRVYNAACRILDQLVTRETARKATESNRDGQPTQTLGASEGQAASGAQEAAQ